MDTVMAHYLIYLHCNRLAFTDHAVGSKTESYKCTEASFVKQYGYFHYPAKFQNYTLFEDK